VLWVGTSVYGWMPLAAGLLMWEFYVLAPKVRRQNCDQDCSWISPKILPCARGRICPDFAVVDSRRQPSRNVATLALYPDCRADRTLWKNSQTAMLAIHGNLAFPRLGTPPSSKKPTLRGWSSLLVACAGCTKRTAIARKS